MKKLNITKEAFEKSRYFKNKYGTLEYVSESGKLFKTNKGKVLMFKEGIGDSIKRGWNKIKSGANKVGHFIGRSAMMQPKGDHIEVWNAKYLSKGEAERANSPVMSGKIVLSSRIDGRYIFEIDGDIDSSVKIGDFMDFQNIDTPHRERGTGYVEKINGNKLYLRIHKDMISDKSNFKESSKKFGKKFKESVGDVATDPAYVCPYCGSRNCEFDDAEDIGSGLTEGYFDGATFNAQFWCNDCNKPYNVTYELKVKDVYPNEDADMMDDYV